MTDKRASKITGLIGSFSSMRMGASGRWSLLMQAVRRSGWTLAIVTAGIGFMTTTRITLDTTCIRGTGLKKASMRNLLGSWNNISTNNGGADVAVVRNRLTNNVFLLQVRRNTFSPNGMASQTFWFNRVLHEVKPYTQPQERNILLDVSAECGEFLFVDPEFRSARKRRQLVYESEAGTSGNEALGPSWLGRLLGKSGAPATKDASAPPRRALVETVVTSEYTANVEGEPVFPFAAVSFDLSIRCRQDYSMLDGTWHDVRDQLNDTAVNAIQTRYLKAIRRKASDASHPAILQERIRTAGLTGRGVTFRDIVENDCDGFAREMHALAVQAALDHRGILQSLTVTVKSTAGEQAVVQRTFGGPSTASPAVVPAAPPPSPSAV
jgi:hypothetical protein